MAQGKGLAFVNNENKINSYPQKQIIIIIIIIMLSILHVLTIHSSVLAFSVRDIQIKLINELVIPIDYSSTKLKVFPLRKKRTLILCID